MKEERIKAKENKGKYGGTSNDDHYGGFNESQSKYPSFREKANNTTPQARIKEQSPANHQIAMDIPDLMSMDDGQSSEWGDFKTAETPATTFNQGIDRKTNSIVQKSLSARNDPFKAFNTSPQNTDRHDDLYSQFTDSVVGQQFTNNKPQQGQPTMNLPTNEISQLILPTNKPSDPSIRNTMQSKSGANLVSNQADPFADLAELIGFSTLGTQR